tara:strand:+ start:1024 stop:2019 length:996 start_codon:yes stop_codon:yes gene_type:complete
VNFSKYKVLFRCDSGDINELGSGHLFRCLAIARYLNIFKKISPNKILFVIKTGKKFNKSLNILKKYPYKVFKIKENIENYSKKEIDIIRKFKADLFIIDRLGNIQKKFIDEALKNFKRKVIIDDSSINRKFFDLSLNPLITKVKQLKNSNHGINFFISPVFFYKKKYIKNFERGVFIYIGMIKNINQIKKVLLILSKNMNLPIYLPVSYAKILKKIKVHSQIIFYQNIDFYKYMYNSKFVIVSGGMSFFDAIFLNKDMVCLPQYKHQIDNVYKYQNVKNIKILIYSKPYFERNFAKSINYFSKKGSGYKKATKGLYKKKMKSSLTKIANLL